MLKVDLGHFHLYIDIINLSERSKIKIHKPEGPSSCLAFVSTSELQNILILGAAFLSERFLLQTLKPKHNFVTSLPRRGLHFLIQIQKKYFWYLIETLE